MTTASSQGSIHPGQPGDIRGLWWRGRVSDLPSASQMLFAIPLQPLDKTQFLCYIIQGLR